MKGSWKTTVVGLVLAIFVAVEPLLSGETLNWKSLVLAALIAGLTYLAKDYNVTGGTIDNGKLPE